MIPVMKKMLMLLLLAVRWYSSSAPLSLIQRQISDIYYFGTAMPPKVIPRYSNRINSNIQLLIINNGGTVAYAVRETVSYLNWQNWHVDDVVQGNRYYLVPGSMYDPPVALQGISGSQKLPLGTMDSYRKASDCTCPVGFI